MTGYIIDYSGTEYRLPVLMSWEVNHTMGYPADSFVLSFVYELDMLKHLESAVRFRGSYDGKTVFYGVVDEVNVTVSKSGSTAELSGRGMAALLMDNEVESIEFEVCTLPEILRRYTAPFGIECVAADNMGTLQGYTVASGTSAWKALSRFTQCAGGITPRFTRTGELVISSNPGHHFQLDGERAALGYSLRAERYGIISEVLVKNSAMGTYETVRNSEFIAEGGMCRRVVNVPRKTGADAMRYTGDYQIKESKKEKRQLSVTLAEPFSAFPADIVTLYAPKLGFGGEYTICRTKSFADGRGCGEIITLERK